MSELLAEPDVGIIGLGALGSIMARKLLSAGQVVVGWDVQANALETFATDGGQAGSGVGDVAAAPIVISLVSTDEHARQVTSGTDGLMQRLGPGAVHVMMASISPALSEELSQQHAARGQRYVAAPVFGRADAPNPQLTVVCSGEETAFAAARPVLEIVGDVQWVGPGAAQAMLIKTMGNNMIFTAMEMLREMFEFLAAGGVTAQSAQDIVIDGLFPGPTFSGYAQRYRERPDAFHLGEIARKDRRTCLAAAQKLGVTLPLIQFLSDGDLP